LEVLEDIGTFFDGLVYFTATWYFVVIWSILWPFGILSPFWYVVPRKIWQPMPWIMYVKTNKIQFT
jgi:hypothetical protein